MRNWECRMQNEYYTTLKPAIKHSEFRIQHSEFRIYSRRMNKENTQNLFQEIISHCKECGFIFPSSEIYDGLSAVYDYGQYGSELKKNIRDHWWKSMTQLQDNIVGIDAAIFMHP